MYSPRFHSPNSAPATEVDYDVAINEIEALRSAVDAFDYAALRSVELPKESDPFFESSRKRACASAEIVTKLISMFATTFARSETPAVRILFSGLQNWPIEQKNLVMKLGETLLMFRNKIQDSETAYFSDMPAAAKLVDDSTWVLRFHYIIEQHLDRGLIQGIHPRRYADFVKNLKRLGEDVFAWVRKHAPDEISRFSILRDSSYDMQKRTQAEVEGEVSAPKLLRFIKPS